MSRALFLCLLFGTSVSAQIAVVSAASYQPTVAPNSIASLFGTNLANSTPEGATKLPLPTSLAGASVTVNGTAAQLFYASSTQINFLVPNLAAGNTTVVAKGPGGSQTTTITISTVAPGLFTANTQGWGFPAAYWVMPSAPTIQNPTVNADGTPVSVPGGAVLVLFGTGLRGAASTSVSVTALAGNHPSPVPVQFAGAQSGFVGLDQVNVALPATLNNLGNIDLVLVAGGVRANSVRIVSGTITSAANPIVLNRPPGVASTDTPALASKANLAAAVGSPDALGCGPSLVKWDLDLLTSQNLNLPADTCLVTGPDGPGVLLASSKIFLGTRTISSGSNFNTNQMAVADLLAGTLRLVAINHFFAATPAQLGEQLVFFGQQQPGDTFADSINVVYTDAATADSRPVAASDGYMAQLRAVIDPFTRTAILPGQAKAAFARLAPGSAATSQFAVQTSSYPSGTSALATLGIDVLPAAGKAVSAAQGNTAGQALFYNSAKATVAGAALPSDATLFCYGAEIGSGLEDQDIFAISSGSLAVTVHGNGCSRLLVWDGNAQTVTPLSAPAGIASLGALQGLNSYVFAVARTDPDPTANFDRLVVLKNGTQISQIVPPNISRLEPPPPGGYSVKASTNEVYVIGTQTDTTRALLVFHLDAGTVTVLPAPAGMVLTASAFPSRFPNRVYVFGSAALDGSPQLITFDIAAGTSSAFQLPDGTLNPVGYNPNTAIILFNHESGAMQLRLQ